MKKGTDRRTERERERREKERERERGVANAKFSLLKLLIYEPYYLCLSRLECQA